MKSTQNEYFVGLDHVRALAAFLVFTWHFNVANGSQLGGPEIFPLSVFAEGHIGVSVFMCLSGYLFAKLLDGQGVYYLPFLWNRCIRLFPLLIVVFVITGVVNLQPGEVYGYLYFLLQGFVKPLWPNGGWSIAIELHFYIILPLLLAISSRNPASILIAVAASLSLRTFLWLQDGTVQHFAYWTIVGGIDQFVLGIFAFKVRDWMRGRHVAAVGVMVFLGLYMTYFDALGGFSLNQGYPSASALWIFHPTILAVVFSASIAWYDTSFSMKNRGLSGIVAGIGACSYSIYLLHFYVVWKQAHWIRGNLLELSNFPMVLFFSLLSFLSFAPFAYIFYRLIELPPLRYRLSYKKPLQG